MASAAEVREDPILYVTPDVSLILTLRPLDDFDGCFMAFDCSPKMLKRANTWGRSSHAPRVRYDKNLGHYFRTLPLHIVGTWWP